MKCSLRAICLLVLPLLLAPGAIAAQELPEIFMAILEGDVAGVEAALDSGVDPNLTVEERTPLMFAVWQKHMEIVEILVARGANLDGETALGVPLINIAAEVGSLEMLTYLLERGADINARGTGMRVDFDREPSKERPPLMMAIRYVPLSQRPPGVRFLIEHGADVDAQDVDGWTALILASSRGDLNSVKALIEAGADVNLKTVDGVTALDHARELVMDPPLVVEALLAAGAKGG